MVNQTSESSWFQQVDKNLKAGTIHETWSFPYVSFKFFLKKARLFRPAPVPQVDPETQAAIEAAKEAQQAAAKANGGGCGASWIRLGEKISG